MIRAILVLIVVACLMASCRSTRKIQTAIAKKDTVVASVEPSASHEDSAAFIRSTIKQVYANKIDFTTFSAKLDVDYQGADDKKYNINANLRMYKDSVIWISVTALFGTEFLRVYITKDSVKLLNKQEKTYTGKSVSYLQEITALPLTISSVQELLIGNPVFVDSSNIVSYSKKENSVSLLSVGDWFKNLITLGKSGKMENCKLDDVDINRSRSCNLTYTDYENKKGHEFASKRRITITEKAKQDIKLSFKQYEFNETLSFPFSVPKNYKPE